MPKVKHVEGLNYKRINELLGLKLSHDTVYMSDLAVEHIKERHPQEYKICLTNLTSVIAKPDYIGQSPRHKENFEMIKIVDGKIILLALSSQPDEYGDYPLRSMYLIDKSTLNRQLRKKHLQKFGK